ncbi:helix-turn-helix domain-containing protein [Xenorhabdus bovienii]|uniref:S24 family peptidase n=1 Tax=Xenorhabdus bovienii TaxID=40576 RepID=UPI0023B22FF2|nr:S24 family peptidase [Xenorhabdus bovienii]MDE9499337.1 helix-turn-helix domain-containing protein [Xenorhabdus bovienii]
MSSNSDILNKNIKYLMHQAGITSVTELSKRIKMQQPTLHRMITGEIKDPKYTNLKHIADFFRVSPIDLIECDLQDPEPTTLVDVNGDYYVQNFTNVPVRNDVVISDNDQCREMFADYFGHADYIRWPSYDRDAYAVKCAGTAMMPRIKESEFVIVEPNHEIAPGDEVLIVTTDGVATVKTFLFERDGHCHLLPVNEDHAPIRIPKSTVSIMHYVAGIAKSALLRKLSV